MGVTYNPFIDDFDFLGSSITNPLTFKGEIAVDGDFPASPSTGDFYIVTGSVTDSNTSQSFISGDEIVWNGTNWTLFGNSQTETDPLSLHLDQTSPQTITGGIPLLTGLTPTTDYEIATKKYVDDNAVVDTDTEMPKVTVGNGSDLIVADTTGTFWIAPWAGSIVSWAIWTGDGSSKTITTTVKKNGTTIGEDIDLTADDYATDTCSVSFAVGDKFSFNVDSNTDARKIIIQLLAEKS